MDARDLKAACLSMPGSFEDFPFGPESSVFKIRGRSGREKMFALSALSAPRLTISLKCDPVVADQLRGAYPEITGAYHMNKKHWNGVDCTGQLTDRMIVEMIEDSYDLVVSSLPRADREALGWQRIVDGGAAE
ncbi:MmcQ/YjbR family DNA-binding protein [Spelaeicoccus albus]|uniref:Putative DNA-binding protein (MmcQ/YjbR family) n=1 Tax=Spelaeicoccus albus TaxID=1280376 RepID=A0A7Z0D209_9MICO|nr:MmcQ/YjbR family DNA-binding protein [Spelaeicoccus albus]NYI67392.1 putative DNA-binding protein (MmcQ/YjbR family) [Spelaeicoccus albus]